MAESDKAAIVDPAAVAACWEANADTWTRHARAGYDVYRDALNTPAFLAILPPVRGLLGLDIGCGEGSNTRQLAKLGASMDAIDIAAMPWLPRPRIRSPSDFRSRTEPICLLLRACSILPRPLCR
jgi:hypothetical protein